MGKLISLAEYAQKHGIAPVTLRQKACRGNIEGAVKIGRNWCIDEDAEYIDHRVKSGNYIGEHQKRKKKEP